MITSRFGEKAYTGQTTAVIIEKNRGMRFCSQAGRFSAVVAGLAIFAVPVVFASDAKHIASQPVRARSVVRADTRTGRLFRTVVVTPRVVASRPISDSQKTSNAAPVADLIESTAKKYDVDPLLVHSVIQAESAYNPYAVSHKGAQGMMQLMPGTARRFGVRNSFDTRENIEGGVRYLKYLDSLFPNDLRLTLAAYNAGEGAVWKHRNKIPPYRETEAYVYKVGMRYGKALREAEKKRLQKPVAKGPSTENADDEVEPTYARVVSYVDSNGRLHLRTVSTP
jgi:soluble lytic murein transglycosylase-like protein